ncbi:MAG: polyribonucleotide nucleotidyltransferase [Patescibacteria group bacterium]
MEPQKFETDLGGKKLIIEVGRYASQAHGSCTVQYGDTVILATAVMNEGIREGVDYFPLMVDYEEKLYAAGKIKGSRFIKREGRPSTEAVLSGRLIDRSIRPLFDNTVRQDVQVILTILSVDQENDPDILSLIAASAAVAISPIPWAGPIAGVRVGQIEDEWVLNPTYEAREKTDFELVIVGREEEAIMIEASGNQISEDTILGAIKFGQKHLNVALKLIEEVVGKVGEAKKIITIGEDDEEEKAKLEKIRLKVADNIKSKFAAIFKETDNKKRKEIVNQYKDELEENLKEDSEVTKEQRLYGVGLVDEFVDDEARRLVLEDETRVDGRKLDEIRPLSAQVGLLPRTHGSGLFNRGETQVLSVVTLGAPGDELVLDTMEESGKRRYMHHYNFPGFSVGEVAPLRGPGRREIGHGALAEKAIVPLLPDEEKFPYTIRVVSEVLSSNGSTSQASACGSSLALMDAGVPLKEAVAGIAMGLITDKESGKYKILTDIQGIEDHAGDMDFKVAGTKNGVTAIQMDTKLHGLKFAIVEETLAKAKEARLKILEVMNKVIAEPRAEMSPYAPRIVTLMIDPDKIRDVIGPGGKIINKIIDDTGVAIDIEKDGTVMITSENAEGLKEAVQTVKDITREVVVGEVYEGEVTNIVKDRNSGKEIGAIVELLPSQDGMVHISAFSHERIDRVSDVVKVGEKLKVKVMGIDKEKGRIELSHKVFEENAEERPNRPKSPFKKPFGKSDRPYKPRH